ncbi:MAG: 1-deoxy-D-xylulose-5-phosphate reductoisomerase [Clostridia bacterium]
MRRIAILGSTGSIGKQVLEVVASHKQDFRVISLTAYSNAELLQEQALKFLPTYLGLVASDGKECLTKAVEQNIDLAIFATSGIDSLDAFIYCLLHNIDIAVANKEIIVCGGDLIARMRKNSLSKVFPIDSEHSAIWQCADGKPIQKITITASGGSFYNELSSRLEFITYDQAKKHPKWNMGADITIDSNTMFNKTMEVLEAHFLFDVPISNIDIVVHPQCIVHSFVQFVDGSTLAQLAQPDMRLPIQYALTYPTRIKSQAQDLKLTELRELNFLPLDKEKFPCSVLCYNQQCNSGIMPTVMVASCLALRKLFEKKKIHFTDFYKNILFVADSFYPSLKSMEVTKDNIFKVYSLAYKFLMDYYEEK